MDANKITNEELLKIPDPPSSAPSVQDLVLTAIATLTESPLTSTNLTELDIAECTSVVRSLYRGTKFSSLSSTKSKLHILSHLCRIRNLPSDGTREELYNHLIAEVRSEYLFTKLFII